MQKRECNEFVIYRHFPISNYTVGMVSIIFIFFVIGIGDWVQVELMGLDWMLGNSECGYLTVNQNIGCGALLGFLCFSSRLIATLAMKASAIPILKFDVRGIWYTPFIWNKSRLYKWDTIAEVGIAINSKLGKCDITVTIDDEECVAINDIISPTSCSKLLEILRYHAKFVPIKIKEDSFFELFKVCLASMLAISVFEILSAYLLKYSKVFQLLVASAILLSLFTYMIKKNFSKYLGSKKS